MHVGWFVSAYLLPTTYNVFPTCAYWSLRYMVIWQFRRPILEYSICLFVKPFMIDACTYPYLLNDISHFSLVCSIHWWCLHPSWLCPLAMISIPACPVEFPMTMRKQQSTHIGSFTTSDNHCCFHQQNMKEHQTYWNHEPCFSVLYNPIVCSYCLASTPPKLSNNIKYHQVRSTCGCGSNWKT